MVTRSRCRSLGSGSPIGWPMPRVSGRPATCTRHDAAPGLATRTPLVCDARHVAACDPAFVVARSTSRPNRIQARRRYSMAQNSGSYGRSWKKWVGSTSSQARSRTPSSTSRSSRTADPAATEATDRSRFVVVREARTYLGVEDGSKAAGGLLERRTDRSLPSARLARPPPPRARLRGDPGVERANLPFGELPRPLGDPEADHPDGP
jgi:hypothetical protein